MFYILARKAIGDIEDGNNTRIDLIFEMGLLPIMHQTSSNKQLRKLTSHTD